MQSFFYIRVALNLSNYFLLEQHRFKPKPSTNVLHGIYEIFRRTEEEKKRLALESGLYKRWRNAFAEESILLNSKNNHEALAKMNWMDKQVEMYIQKEKEKEEHDERQLRLQEEAHKQEDIRNQRKQLREDEIRQLKSIQETHVNEMKERINQTDQFRAEEEQLRTRKQNIAEEFAKLDLNSRERKERSQCPHNIRRIKMLLRQRSDAIRRDLRDDIDMMTRITGDNANDQIDLVKENFEMQYDLEIQKQSQIEAMYESEAKHLLIKQDQLWDQEATARENILKKLIAEQIQHIDNKLQCNLQKQRDLIEIKESHIHTIESANGRLKELIEGNRADEFDGYSSCKQSGRTENTIENINLADKFSIGNESASRSSSSASVESNCSSGPKYGRKKIAWT